MLTEDFYEFAKSQSVFKRLGTGEDVAQVVGFLAGEKSEWVTGQNIIVGGGSVIVQ
jgi:3-oxoacyl-[acyl-carrier protein] reductase